MFRGGSAAPVFSAATTPMRTADDARAIPLFHAIDWLFAEINFKDEIDATQTENIAKAKFAFENFLSMTDMQSGMISFHQLLQEKSGEHEFRADGVTPNWYHEFREILPVLACVRNGLISEHVLDKYGGLDTIMSAIMRHDSLEDFGVWPDQITNMLNNPASLKDIFGVDEKAKMVGLIVDLLSRKIPLRHEDTGEFWRDERGKIICKNRYHSIEDYIDRQILHPFAVWAKYNDSQDGVATRPGVAKFTTAKNIKYAADKRRLYTGREISTINAWPEFEAAFMAVDSMLAITLRLLEVYNKHCEHPQRNSINKGPIRVKKFVARAKAGYAGVPDAFRPDVIMMGRLEALARSDLKKGDIRLACMLEREIYPALVDLIGDRRQSFLQNDSICDYTL